MLPARPVRGLRAHVVAGIRERAERWWKANHWPHEVGAPPASWLDLPRAARLEAGKPEHVASHELPSSHPGHSGTRWYTLEPDGSLTELGRE